MKAKRIDGQAVNCSRQRLADALPLDTPYAITIFPIYACNFKCSYCIHSLSREKRSDVCENVMMDFDLYKKCIDEMAMFPRQIKALHFAGLGEPLVYPQIIEMIEYAKKKNIAETIDIITNGMLLTKKIARQLIATGIDKIRISLQGLNSEMYKNMSDVEMDFVEFKNNLQWLYENRGDTKIYIKIMDVSLKEHSEEEFFDLFGDMADYIAIEHLCPLSTDIDYENQFQQDDFIYTMNGNIIKNAQVCPQPFYSLQINPDGDCIPCCTIEKPVVIGNCHNKTLIEIWNGESLKSFRKKHLQKEKDEFPVCKTCSQYKYGMFPEDILDDKAENILGRCF